MNENIHSNTRSHLYHLTISFLYFYHLICIYIHLLLLLIIMNTMHWRHQFIEKQQQMRIHAPQTTFHLHITSFSNPMHFYFYAPQIKHLTSNFPSNEIILNLVIWKKREVKNKLLMLLFIRLHQLFCKMKNR